MMNFVSMSAVSISIPFQLLKVSQDQKKKNALWKRFGFALSLKWIGVIFLPCLCPAHSLQGSSCQKISSTMLRAGHSCSCFVTLMSVAHCFFPPFVHFWNDAVVYINVIYSFKSVTRYAFFFFLYSETEWLKLERTEMIKLYLYYHHISGTSHIKCIAIAKNTVLRKLGNGYCSVPS